MRRINWVVPAYAVAVIMTLIALASGNLTVTRVFAALPFAVLLAAIATAPGRVGGRAIAAAGLILTAVAVTAFMSPIADLVSDLGIGLGMITLAVAMLAAGGWQVIKRNKRLAIIFSVVTGLVAVIAIAGIITSLPGALNPPRGCVDTCIGPAIGVLLGGIVLAEILALILLYAALITNAAAGIGALIMVVATNVLFFITTPTWSAGYAAALVAWFAGIFIVALPWTLAKLPRLGRPPTEARQPALD